MNVLSRLGFRPAYGCLGALLPWVETVPFRSPPSRFSLRSQPAIACG